MNYDAFILSLKNDNPPFNLSNPELAMWHTLKNNWNDAHKIIQEIDNEIAAWIHAYLHRLEGDVNNANYWYKRANKTPTNESFKDEAKNIISFLHNKKSSMID